MWSLHVFMFYFWLFYFVNLLFYLFSDMHFFLLIYELVCASQFVVMFTGHNDSANKTLCNAYISRSTRGLRALLREHVSWTCQKLDKGFVLPFNLLDWCFFLQFIMLWILTLLAANYHWLGCLLQHASLPI